MTTARLGPVSNFPVGTMHMARVGDRRVAVVHTSTGLHAIDNACPHQGYGLVTGSLSGDVVTCLWHNWKFRVSDGACLMGEEDVAHHEVVVDDGEVVVTVHERSGAEEQKRLFPSLGNAIANNYVGQMARDTARLLRAGATPAEIVWQAVEYNAPRNEYGINHGLANATDCLARVNLYEGDEQTIPLAHALAGLAEEAFGYPARPPAEAVRDWSAEGFAAAVESEEHDVAIGHLVGALHDGADDATMRRWLIHAVSQHHLDYGHGAIFVQKSCQMLDAVGWQHAERLLPHMVTGIVLGTREDTLPYMRKSMTALDKVDLVALATTSREPGWSDDGSLRAMLLAAGDLPARELADAAHAGAGIDGLLDVIALAASERLLRYDPAIELEPSENFRWLDISHALTYANAARWAWRHHPSPDTARLVMFCAFLVVDSGRDERRKGAAETPTVEPLDGDLVAAILDRRYDDAARHAAAGTPTDVAEQLVRAALSDQPGSFIVAAHAVKTSVAAAEETENTGSMLPLIATARFLAAPRQERFVSSAASEAIHFVRTGQPPRR
jgi:nitrite reductase/ring-hydroxylating ferredoxin subunit